MRPKFQSKQSAVINAPIKNMWEYNQDLAKIPDYHPQVKSVDLISGKRFREVGVAYQCHLNDGKNTCIEKDIEIIPLQKIVTVFTSDTMSLTKLLPDYIVESTLKIVDNSTTKVEISFLFDRKTQSLVIKLYYKHKIAREAKATLNAMKNTI